MSDEKCILVFLKTPERGMVKSRLSKDMDEDVALLLYKNFILDLLETLQKGRFAIKICFYPPNSKEKVSNWLGKNYSYMPQNGIDLGERMKNAFREAFSEGFSKVLLIGSDIPDLTTAVINEAFAFDNNAAVIGPAFDGGYYLIGFKDNTFLPDVFEGIQWGQEMVFEKTMEIFKKHNYAIHLLPQWQDIDKLDDLQALYDRNMNTAFARSRTMTFIAKNLKKIFLTLTILPYKGGK